MKNIYGKRHELISAEYRKKLSFLQAFYFDVCLETAWQAEKTHNNFTRVAKWCWKGKFLIRIPYDVNKLQITVKWSPEIMIHRMMHKNWLNTCSLRHAEYHPEIAGFGNAMKTFRLRGSDWIESKSELDLPFPVQTVLYEEFS